RVVYVNCGAVVRRDGKPGGRHVVGERQSRVLDDADVVAIPFQDLVDTLPPGAVHEAAVYENDTQCLVSGHEISFLQQRMQPLHRRAGDLFESRALLWNEQQRPAPAWVFKGSARMTAYD